MGTVAETTRGGELVINAYSGPEGTFWNIDYLNGEENAATLLHELGHKFEKMGVKRSFVNDTSIFGKGDPAKSKKNDDMIWRNCLGKENPH